MTSCGSCGDDDAFFTRPFHENEEPSLCPACFSQACEEEFEELERKMEKLRDAHLDWSKPIDSNGKPPVPLMTNDERCLRHMFAICHAGARLYCDDGELQDGSILPAIDFLRDPVPVIRAKLQRRAYDHQDRPTVIPEVIEVYEDPNPDCPWAWADLGVGELFWFKAKLHRKVAPPEETSCDTSPS